MAKLRKREREELIQLLEAGKPIPPQWRHKIFPDVPQSTGISKEYHLEYAGKKKREQVLAETPAAPWQLVRNFAEDNPHEDNWRNLLVWGDNLLALRELLADQQGPNLFGTRGKIKLIYIDPPFATKQDFMKDKEKAYRDKVIGAQFIEFIRRRLILLRELLADDGSIYVHLDTKKGHYIKAVLDEIFGEENFQNQIIWKRQSAHNDAGKCGAIHDTILFYTKNKQWIWNDVRMPISDKYIQQFFDQVDSSGRRYARGDLTAAGVTKAGDSGKPWRSINVSAKGRHWAIPEDAITKYGIDPFLNIQDKLDALDEAGAIHWPKKGVPRLKRFVDEVGGVSLQDVWTDIKLIHNQSSERTGYPTQKPEEIAARIINASSNKDDIVLDCFVGSGTMTTVAEKLGRRWIAMDCGKLSIYTTQKRLFSLKTTIGSKKKDERVDSERIVDWNTHLKKSQSILFITEKSRKGECEVTLDLLSDIAKLVLSHKLLRSDAFFALACPQEKLLIPKDEIKTLEDGPGQVSIEVDGIEFRISIIKPKEKSEKEKPLSPKEFSLYRAGLYDMQSLREMTWNEYRPFVLKLFGVREDSHTRYGLHLDGYLGTHSTLVWNYPDHTTLTLDYGYVEDLHQTLRGKKGERFYVIAPVVAMDFAEDEIVHKGATYVFLKVPLSILMRLLEKNSAGALKQPMRESEVNEVVDAIGFDFISQPSVKFKAGRMKRKGELFADIVIEISEFRTQTLATDPEDFENFETFSMAMMDLDYDDDVFQLSRVFWGEDLIKEAGGIDKAKKLNIRIPENEFEGNKMMLILCDRYGNEKTLLFKKEDF